MSPSSSAIMVDPDPDLPPDDGGDPPPPPVEPVEQDLWYVLAAANAVSDEDLVAGTTLKAPQVKTTANDASTFKPYDPNSITGPTTPSLPYISAPPQHGCNVLATVIRVFVAVVVTYFTLNPAAGAAVAGIGEAAAQTVEIEDGDRQGYDWGQVGVSALTAGFAASEAGQSFGAWAAQSGRTGQFVRGAALAAASDVASDALHKALGENASFSLRGVVSDSLAAGISAGALGPAPTVNGVPAGTASAGAFSWPEVARAAVTSVLRQGINYGVHQAIEGRARWNNGQVLGNVAMDVATTVAGTAFAAQRQRDAEARQMHSAAWVDGNPFNGGIAGDDSIPDLSTDAGLSAAIAQIWAANADQPMLASGYGGEGRKLGSPTLMSTDRPYGAPQDDFTRIMSDEDLRLSQADIDSLKAQGRDMTAAQQALDEMRQRRYVSGMGSDDQPPLELDIIGGTPESAIAEHAPAFDSWRLTGQEYFDQYRGSVLGDLFANAGTIANNGGLSAIQGVSSLIDLVTDGASDREVLTNVGQAMIHPVRTYEHAVAAMTGFYEQPLGEQARIIGSGSVAMLLGGAVKVPLPEAPSVDSLFPRVANAARVESMPVGLRTRTIVAPETVERYLIERVGWSPTRATGYVDSFEGPITARIGRPGEQYLRYLDGPDGKGSFLTRSEFFSPVDARSGLNLDPALTKNLATSRQVVTAQRSSIVFEGAVRGGTPGVQQTVITDWTKFLFDPAYRYY